MLTSAARSPGLLALMLMLVAGIVEGAPSFPIPKPQVLPMDSGAGPTNDPNAVTGQWFQVLSSGELTVRSHEFYDNVQGDGGGATGHLAIVGRVVNVEFGDDPFLLPIVAFDVDAVVCNDTPGTGSSLNGSNSHFEVQTAMPVAGALKQVILTADFAVLDPEAEIPVVDPYRDFGPKIVATNMDVAGWFCWTEDGDFSVPGWSFGDIEPGQSSTQRLNFVVSGTGMPSYDPRYAAIMQSWTLGTDIFLNRSLSLKISDWINDLGVDLGDPYPDTSLRSSDVSVFHNMFGIRRRAKKWVQPPDWVMGESMPSFTVVGGGTTNMPLRADDWLCDGRRVTDIHWWGSYLDYRTNTADAVAPPTQLDYRPLGFNLSWHVDVPGTPSHPGILLTNVFVPMAGCNELHSETVLKSPGVYEHAFQYYVDLLDPAIGVPWAETNGVVYWLNVQAVFPLAFEQPGGGPDAHTGWGWTTTPLTNRWNDASVVASNSQPWQVGVYPTNHPFYPQPCDLAFELTTDEVGGGTNWWNEPIVIRGILKPVSAGTSVASVGDVGVGVQVLQAATDLQGSNWVDVVTNVLPLAAPHTNLWLDEPAVETTKFYRVIQR